MKTVKIEIDEYNYDCADGCCTHYGTKISVNGCELPVENSDIGTQIKQILKHLGYEVEIIETYNGETH